MSIFSLKKNVWYLTVITVILFSFSSCNDFSFQNGIDHGRIEYDISYPQIPTESYILDLMPKKMETTFKNNSYKSDIIAGMGLFKTSIICESGKDQLIHSVKMLNKKYASELSSEEIIEFNPNFQELQIILKDDKKEIAGYHCNRAEVKVLGDSSWTFNLYYTDEINIKDANLHSPFKEIKGVLMEYELLSYNTHMRFTASKVLKTEVDKKEIKLEDGYEMVSPSELKKEIESIFAKVK